MRPAAYVGILDAFMMWKCAALPMWEYEGQIKYKIRDRRKEIRNQKYEIRNTKYNMDMCGFADVAPHV